MDAALRSELLARKVKEQYLLKAIKQILVEVGDELARRLEEIAPSRMRQRSEFIRMALVKAIMMEEEKRTAEAYRKWPDDPSAVYYEAREWDKPDRGKRRRRRRP